VRVSVAEPRMSPFSQRWTTGLTGTSQPRNAQVSEAMRTQNSLANGDDKALSLISVPETRRAGAMTDLLLIDSLRPLLFPITQVTGVPTAPPDR
jgi:hypothetical protein